MVKRAPYNLVVRPEAEAELKQLRVFDHRRILEAIVANLTYDATLPSRNRKVLSGVVAGFIFDPPLWELKVGEFRVFYDVSAEQHSVFVRAVRQKLPHQSTQEITR